MCTWGKQNVTGRFIGYRQKSLVLSLVLKIDKSLVLALALALKLQSLVLALALRVESLVLALALKV